MTSRSEDGGLADDNHDDQLRVDLCSFQTLLYFLVSFLDPLALESGFVLRTPWRGQIEEDRNATVVASISNRNLFFQLILIIYVWLSL